MKSARMIRRLCTAMLLAGPGHADTTQLPTIFITASRVAEGPDETLYSTNLVTRDGIAASQANDVSGILQTLPGVQIGRNGGPGQATSLFMRGTASDHTLVLIDGIPVNSGTVGGPALQHLMPDQVDRIEVVRGPASTLYGSNAVGGVVQIFTRRAGPGPRAQITAGAGSHNSDSYAAYLGHGGEDLYADLSLSRQNTRGYPTRPELSTVDRGYRNQSLSGRIGLTRGSLGIELSHYHSAGRVEYLDFFGSPVDQDTENSLTRLAIEGSPNARWDSRLLLGRARDETRENQSDDFANTERDYIDWQNTLHLDPGQILIAGVSASWTETALLSFGSGYDERIRSLEFYLQDTLTFGDARLQIGGRAIDNELYGTHVTWGVAYGYAFNPATRMHANVGTAFRAPSANDLYGFGGDPDFEPETSISAELGIDHRLTARDSVRAAAFQTEIDKLIETDLVTFATEQAEKARIRGVELGYRYGAGRWNGTLDYTYLDPKNLDVDQMLARRSRHTLDAALRYEPGPWWVQAGLHHQSKRRDSRFSTEIMGSYTSVDVTAGYRFGPSLAVSGRVQNLFDEAYELAAGYPAQDRHISVELRYDYDTR